LIVEKSFGWFQKEGRFATVFFFASRMKKTPTMKLIGVFFFSIKN